MTNADHDLNLIPVTNMVTSCPAFANEIAIAAWITSQPKAMHEDLTRAIMNIDDDENIVMISGCDANNRDDIALGILDHLKKVLIGVAELHGLDEFTEEALDWFCDLTHIDQNGYHVPSNKVRQLAAAVACLLYRRYQGESK